VEMPKGKLKIKKEKIAITARSGGNFPGIPGFFIFNFAFLIS